MNQSKKVDIEGKIYVIDRLEKNIAVCENRTTGDIINIDIDELPKEIKEGTVLKYSNNRYIIDISLEKEMQDNIEKLWKKLKNKDY